MSFLKELKIKYSYNNFKKKMMEFMDNHTTELEIDVHVYIDGYHFFNELRKDAKNILNVMKIADELYEKAHPEIVLKERIKEEYSNPMGEYITKVDYNLDYFKLCGLAQRYLLTDFELLMRMNFKERGIDKIFGDFSESERKKIRFDKKENHLTSIIPTLIENLLDDQIDELEKTLSNSAPKELSKDPKELLNDLSNFVGNHTKLEKRVLEILYNIYNFSFQLDRFYPNNKLNLRFKIEEKDYNNFIEKYFGKNRFEVFLFNKLSPKKIDKKSRFLMESFLGKELSELFFEELKKIKNYFNSNEKLILSFLDNHFDPKLKLDYLNNSIFVKLNFNYNIFRSRMDEGEFLKRSRYRQRMNITLEDIKLYENFSNLLEKTLKAETQLGSYKWNDFAFKEKQVDIKLSLACTKKMNATVEKHDLFCLVVNDTDFLPVFEEAKELGSNIFLCSTVKPATISNELKKFLESENIIFPKKYDFNTLAFALFSEFKEDKRWPPWHYHAETPHVPSPSREIIEIIESPLARKELGKSLKNKINEQIKILQSLSSSVDNLVNQTSIASERFTKRDPNILDFKK